MILQSLREMALREGLVEDPAFESKPVRWVIELREDGRFRQLYDTNTQAAPEEGSKKKPRPEATLMSIPRRLVRAGDKVMPQFIVDNPKYVLGIGSSGDVPDPKDARRHGAYVSLLQSAQKQVSAIELNAVIAFLSDESERKRATEKLTSIGNLANNDLFTFQVEGKFLHEVEELRDLWRSMADVEASISNRAQCLVCGNNRPPATLHNQLQIRGGSSSGVPLVSFNFRAAESYGWSGNENANVCTECMTAYVEGLRRMTRARYVNPRTERLVQPQNTVLNGDTTAVYWADNDNTLAAGITTLRDYPQKVKALLQSPRHGEQQTVGVPDRFYCLILTGTQGRAIVRRMHTGTVAEVEDNLRRYFAAIDVDRFDRSVPLPQFRLLKALVLNGELGRLPAELGTDLWLAALFGVRLSRAFLAAVVTRMRVEQQDLRAGKRKVTPERAALLHFYFATHGVSSTTGTPINGQDGKAPKETSMGIDEESEDRAYLLGRVLAVSERMQTLAQSQGLNRTVVDRFYSMASVRPSVVFTELLKLYRHHRTKAMRDIPWLARKTDRTFGDLLVRLNPDALSQALSLEEQGRFGLGYYHQRQTYFHKPTDTNESGSPDHETHSTNEENAA